MATPITVTVRRAEKGFPGGPGSTPSTTGSFTPLAGERLIAAVVGFESNGTTAFSSDYTISDSQGLTWTTVTNLDNPASWAAGVRVWISSPAANSAMTVTFGYGSHLFYDTDLMVISLQAASSNIAGLTTNTNAAVDGGYTVTLGTAPASGDAVFFGRALDNDGSTSATLAAGWTTQNSGSLSISFRNDTTSTGISVTDTNVTPAGSYKSIDFAFIVKMLGEDRAIDGKAIGASLNTGSLSTNRPLTGPASASAVTAGPPRVNLCTNPHADVDTSGWTTAGSISRATGVTGFPKSTAVLSDGATGNVTSAPGAVVAGNLYTMSAQVKNVSALGDCKVYIEWRDSNGDALGYASGPTFVCPTNVVTTVSVTGTAITGTTSAALLFAEIFGARQMGAVLIEPGAVANPYADGSTSGWVWNGTAGLSASTQVGALTNLDVGRPLAGNSQAAASVGGPLAVARDASGQATASATVTANLGLLRALTLNPSSAATGVPSMVFTVKRGIDGDSTASTTVDSIDLNTSNSPIGTVFGGYLANLLDRGVEPVTVYLEEVTFDSDGNTQTRAKTTGIDTLATVQVAAASGTSSRRSEQDNEGFETEENWRIRFPRRFPYLLGAQSKVRWRGLMYSVVGDARRYNGSRRTAHIEYTIRRT